MLRRDHGKSIIHSSGPIHLNKIHYAVHQQDIEGFLLKYTGYPDNSFKSDLSQYQSNRTVRFELQHTFPTNEKGAAPHAPKNGSSLRQHNMLQCTQSSDKNTKYNKSLTFVCHRIEYPHQPPINRKRHRASLPHSISLIHIKPNSRLIYARFGLPVQRSPAIEVNDLRA